MQVCSKNLWLPLRTMLPFSGSEASTCRAAIRAAKNIVSDLGEQTAARSRGLVELGKCTESHSERDVNRVARKYQLLLPVKLSNLPKSPGIRFTGDFKAISLRDWCKFMIDHDCWHVMLGLHRPNPKRECDILSAFWQRFKALRPHHQLWEEFEKNNVDLSRCCPMVFHGDEGRGRKRAPFLVASYHSVLGFGTHAANQFRKHREYLTMKLNYSESTHVTYLLTAVLPKMLKDEVAFQTILQFVTQDSLSMIRSGVQSNHGERHYMAVINCTGDWAFLAKAGNLGRSFSNVEKRPRGLNSNPRGICHYCRAGQINVPFEDFGPNPCWKSTMFEEGDVPFTKRPTLLGIPHEPDREAAFFTYDVWHSLHLGMGKTFTASALALISDRMESTNIDGRFSELTNVFLQWCEECKVTPYVTSISKDTLGWFDRMTFPNGMWSKGHITTAFMKFVAWWLRANVNDVSDCPLLTTSLEAAESLNTCMEQLYRADVWLKREAAHRIGQHGLKFMSCYQRLARLAYDEGKALYIYMPKSHVCHHVFLECAEATAEWTFNPLTFAVQLSEDLVGKKSRLARRVAASQVIVRVLGAIFVCGIEGLDGRRVHQRMIGDSSSRMIGVSKKSCVRAGCLWCLNERVYT